MDSIRVSTLAMAELSVGLGAVDLLPKRRFMIAVDDAVRLSKRLLLVVVDGGVFIWQP